MPDSRWLICLRNKRRTQGLMFCGVIKLHSAMALIRLCYKARLAKHHGRWRCALLFFAEHMTSNASDSESSCRKWASTFTAVTHWCCSFSSNQEVLSWHWLCVCVSVQVVQRNMSCPTSRLSSRKVSCWVSFLLNSSVDTIGGEPMVDLDHFLFQSTTHVPSSCSAPWRIASMTTSSQSSPTNLAPASPVSPSFLCLLPLGLFAIKASARPVPDTTLYPFRHDAAQEGLRGGRQRLSLCGVPGADGAGYPGPPLHWGRTVQQPPVRYQRPVGEGGGWEGMLASRPQMCKYLLFFFWDYGCNNTTKNVKLTHGFLVRC